MANPHWMHAAAEELLLELRATAAAVAADLAPPDRAADGRVISRRQYIEHARAQSYADPMYMQADLERMAPASVPFPDGTMGRAFVGLRNFNAKWREARPDLYVDPLASPVPPAPPAPIAGGY